MLAREHTRVLDNPDKALGRGPTTSKPFLAIAAALVGTGEAPMKMEAMMSDAWLAFAKTGTPASTLLPKWPAYTAKGREVMEFNLDPKVVSDPEKGLREAAAAK